MRISKCGAILTAAAVLTLSATTAAAAVETDSPRGGGATVIESVIEANANVADGRSALDTDLVHDAAWVPTDAASSAAVDAIVQGIHVVIPSSADAPVTVGSGELAVTIGRPAQAAGAGVAVRPGVVANAGDAMTTVTSVNADGSAQIGVIIDTAEAPEAFEFDLGVPAGATASMENGQVFIFAGDGDLVGGFAPPWATDANGVSVPTRFELVGDSLIQHVEHRRSDVAYPVVADPAYANGMISQVKHERWANGGWEVRLTVTALARWTQPVNPGFVYSAGLKDLREHHPRSMQYKTMAQQWDCHVVGLPGTVNIDLESYRRSWDGWRAGILPALIQSNPALACNW